MSYGWAGDVVRLVPLDKERHLENCLRWLNDPDLTQAVLGGDFPISARAENAWFDKMTSEIGGADIVFAIETPAGEHVGLAGIHHIDYRHGTGYTGTIIGDSRDRNQGLGSDAVRIRTRYAFETLGLRLLTSEVMAGNLPSMRVLEKSGYRQCGIIPQRYWKRGEFRDAHQFACLREWWQGTRTGTSDAAARQLSNLSDDGRAFSPPPVMR